MSYLSEAFFKHLQVLEVANYTGFYKDPCAKFSLNLVQRRARDD